MFRDCLATVILITVTDVTSTVGSGATVSTYSRKVITPQSSVGEDDQSNSAGAYPTGNRTTAGINGIAGMPMVGINGHLGLLVAMMMIGGSSRSQ